MDPDAALDRLGELLDELARSDTPYERQRELALLALDQWMALDDWRKKGGFLPQVPQHEPEPAP